MDNLKVAKILLRIGIAFVFVYAAISMSLAPDSWGHYLPSLIRDRFPVDITLHIFGGFEILLSLWLLSGKWNLYASGLSALVLTGLTLVNLDSFSVLFRNVAAICAALALTFLNWQDFKKPVVVVQPVMPPLSPPPVTPVVVQAPASTPVAQT